MTRKVSKATIKFAKFKVVKYGTKTPIAIQMIMNVKKCREQYSALLNLFNYSIIPNQLNASMIACSFWGGQFGTL